MFWEGDPYFVSEKLWQLAVDMRNLGINKVDGSVVIDNSLFDSQTRDLSRQAGKLRSKNAYDAPVTAFAVNFNTVALAIAPGSRVGQPGIVSLDPYNLRNISIVNNTKTSTSSRDKVQVIRQVKAGKTSLIATGVVSHKPHLKKVYRSLGEEIGSGEYMRAFLRSEGIVVAKPARFGVVPRKRKFLLEVQSYPMSKIIGGLNKYSNNYIADVLVKSMAVKIGNNGEILKKGTMQSGVERITAFMKNKVGIRSKFVIKNGSGLSTTNRLSAHQLNQLLVYIYGRLDLFPEFLSSMPASGWDGTLKDRFKKHDRTIKLVGKVRAKTGTLTEPRTVSSLAGYMQVRMAPFCCKPKVFSRKPSFYITYFYRYYF